MKNLVKITKLFDAYGLLLSKKQQQYIIDYYFDDLSLGEMAQNYNISRNAIYSSINEGIKDLNYYENILKLVVKREKLLEIYAEIKDNELREKLINFELNFK